MPGKKKPTKKGLPDSILPIGQKPGIAEIPVEDFYNNISPNDLAMGNWGSTLSDRVTESTLTEADLIDAMEMLRGNTRFKLPQHDVTNASWALAAALTLIKVLRLRITESNSGGAALFGNTLRMEMEFPFSRRNRMNTTTSQMIDREYTRHGKTSLLDIRMAIADKHVHDHFSVIEKWIDIAKNAKENYTVEDLLRIENIEQRMAALRIFGAEKLIEEAGAKLVSKSRRGNELYLIPKTRKLFDDDAYFLKYQCVSTGRIYVSGVPNWLFNQQLAATELSAKMEREMWKPGFGMMWRPMLPNIEEKYIKRYPETEWADLGMAWKFRLTLEEYKALSVANEG